MAALVGNTSSTTVNAQNFNFNHTFPSGSNLLVVLLALGDSGSSVTVTWDAAGDNISLTLLDRLQSVGAGCQSGIYYGTGMSVKTGQIDVTTAAKGQHGAAGIDFSGADTPDNFGSDAILSSESTASVTVSGAAAGDMLVDSIFFNGGSITVGANQTEIYNAAGGGKQHAASYQSGADGGVMSFSFGSGSDGTYVACRIPGFPVFVPMPLRRRPYNNTLLRM